MSSSTPKPPPEGRDPREANAETQEQEQAPDRAQSPARGTMDPLPPVNESQVLLGQEGARAYEQGVAHRESPASQKPVPSERMFPSVEDDRVLQPRPGPPLPEGEGAERDDDPQDR